MEFSFETVQGNPEGNSADSGAGLRVGEKVPDFDLVDSDGRLRRLSELAQAGPAVLVFYRGHW